MKDRFKFRMYDTNINKMYMPNDFEEDMPNEEPKPVEEEPKPMEEEKPVEEEPKSPKSPKLNFF